MKSNITHYEISPGKDDNFSIARFSLYCPPKGDNFKYILSLMPGINEDGTTWLNNDVWIDFSKKNNCPVLASYFHTTSNFTLGKIFDGSAPKMTYYVVPKGGSGKAYLKALKSCIATSNKSFSKNTGMLLFGYSAGGIFNHNFAIDYPDRVSAFVVNKGGGAYIKGNKRFFTIPGLFFLGEKDKPFRKSNIQAAYAEGVGYDAPWLLIRESGIDHSLGKSVELSLEFFSRIIQDNQEISLSTEAVQTDQVLIHGPKAVNI